MKQELSKWLIATIAILVLVILALWINYATVKKATPRVEIKTIEKTVEKPIIVEKTVIKYVDKPILFCPIKTHGTS